MTEDEYLHVARKAAKDYLEALDGEHLTDFERQGRCDRWESVKATMRAETLIHLVDTALGEPHTQETGETDAD